MNVVSKILNKFDEQEKFKLNVSIFDYSIEIFSTSQEALNYLKELFYPDNTNCLSQNKVFLGKRDLLIKNINMDESELKDIMHNIIISWIYLGIVHPIKTAEVKKYIYNSWQAYIQSNKDKHSNPYILFKRENEIIIITTKGFNNYKLLSWIVREIAGRRLENNGYSIFHAGAVNINGKGVAIFGNSGAGKTTLALGLCKYEGAKYISSDRLYIKNNDINNCLESTSFSFPIRINYGTLLTLQEMNNYEKWNLQTPVPGEDTTWKQFDGKDKLEITPYELEQKLLLQVSAKTNIDIVIFLNLLTNSNMNEYIYETNSELLETNCWTPTDPSFAYDWLSQRNISDELLLHSSKKIINSLMNLTNIKVKYSFLHFRDLCKEIARLT